MAQDSLMHTRPLQRAVALLALAVGFVGCERATTTAPLQSVAKSAPAFDATTTTTTNVYGSGISPVTAWDPIFPATAFPFWPNECKESPDVGLDANWVNPHNAFVFPFGTHPWENIAPFNFHTNWINAFPQLGSEGPDGQSWTKYSTTVQGTGQFVVQFLADNCSWIYLDQALVGVQHENWQQEIQEGKSTGQYIVTLNGAPQTLTFIIFDGGGDAGGKFRLETTQSFVSGGGDPATLPPAVTPTDNTAPVIAPTVTGTSGTGGWFTSDVNVTWSVTDAESPVSSSTGCDASSVTTNTTADGTTFTCSATSAGGSASQSVTVKRDASAPVVTATAAGASTNGWFTSDATITWQTSDAESGIASTTCQTQTLNTDATSKTYTCTATNNAGLVGNGTITVKRDASAPVVTGTASGASTNGWFTGDVTISWQTSDPQSGVASTTCQTQSLATDIASKTYACGATNGAGLTGNGSVTVRRDATPPSIAFAGNQSSYTVDQTVSITCSASDAMSGLASNTCANTTGDAYTFALGSHTLSASATDNAGNGSNATATFTVSATSGSLCALVNRWVNQAGIANSMCQQLDHGDYGAFENHVSAQSGKSVTAAHADILIALAKTL
jgi:hypothetical protein